MYNATINQSGTIMLEIHQRLIKAREDCLLGNYATGIQSFHAILLELKRRCAFTVNEDVKEVFSGSVYGFFIDIFMVVYVRLANGI